MIINRIIDNAAVSVASIAPTVVAIALSTA